jgi:hypothetical protein
VNLEPWRANGSSIMQQGVLPGLEGAVRRMLANTAGAVIALAAILGGVASATAQNDGAITRPIDETQLVTLAGNTRPEANAANDRGTVADGLPIEHMLSLMRRSAAKETALGQTIDDLQDPHSPDYHHWLTAAEFGALWCRRVGFVGSQWLALEPGFPD